jgi:hypothetical protein
MKHRLLRPKSALRSYGPLPRGVGGAPLGVEDTSPLVNDSPEYPGEAGKGYDNPLAAKGTESPLNENFEEGIPSSKLSAVEIHETPTMLPPRNDLRRHIDEDEVEEVEEGPVMMRRLSRLMAGLSVARIETN